MTPSMLIASLKAHEGKRLRVYDDATGADIGPGSHVVGHPTIGYGRALDVRGITDAEAEAMLRSAADEAWAEAAVLTRNFFDLTVARQSVLAEMVYQIGAAGVRRFIHTLAAIEAEHFDQAAREMLDSDWARQTPTRAAALAQRMRDGA